MIFVCKELQLFQIKDFQENIWMFLDVRFIALFNPREDKTLKAHCVK